ncbi:MAG TPA: FMN-binding protein [Acidimicrobiales bacterium]|nr:FMN-binding protein [Acidimicrobiales bacterium]
MKRALAAAGGTVAGLAALLSYKSGPAPSRTVVAGGDTGASAPTVPTTVPPDQLRRDRGFGDDDFGGATPPPTTPSTAGAPPVPGKSGTFTGSVERNRFGDVQVQVVIKSGRITDVVPLQLPSDRARSAFISEQAAPMLRQEALDAQSAQIDIVSGATYTSEGYAASLQAALDASRR